MPKEAGLADGWGVRVGRRRHAGKLESCIRLGAPGGEGKVPSSVLSSRYLRDTPEEPLSGHWRTVSEAWFPDNSPRGRELNLKAGSVGSYGQSSRRPPGSCAQDVNQIKDCGSKCLDSTKVSGHLFGQE